LAGRAFNRQQPVGVSPEFPKVVILHSPHERRVGVGGRDFPVRKATDPSRISPRYQIPRGFRPERATPCPRPASRIRGSHRDALAPLRSGGAARAPPVRLMGGNSLLRQRYFFR